MKVEIQVPANSAVNVINPDTLVTIRSSTGYTIGAGMRQEPSYVEATGKANLQAISNDKLQHIDGLNLQGTYKVLYLHGQLYAVVRPEIKGGDLVLFNGQNWLVVQLLERWQTWCKALICLQSP